MSAYTKGPWEVARTHWTEDRACTISINAPNGGCVGGSMILDDATVEALTEEELEANARLIAAAPEMYEFLTRLAKRKPYLAGELYDLIAKAEGK